MILYFCLSVCKLSWYNNFIRAGHSGAICQKIVLRNIRVTKIWHVGGTPSGVVYLCSAQPAQLHVAGLTLYFPFGNSHRVHNDLFNAFWPFNWDPGDWWLCVPAVCSFQESMVQEITQYSLTELVWIWILIKRGLGILGCSVLGCWTRSVLFCSRVLFKRFQFPMKHNS